MEENRLLWVYYLDNSVGGVVGLRRGRECFPVTTRWRANDSVWLVPTWVPPTPEPE